MKKSMVLMLVSILLVACSPASGDLPSHSQVRSADVEAYNIDFNKFLKKFDHGDPLLLQKYWDATAHANPYLTDAFGLHILKGVSRDQVTRDFVPKHASLISDKGNEVVLLFEGKYTLEFHFNKVLAFPDRPLGPEGYTYIWFADPTAEKLIGGLESFHSVLEAEGLAETYQLSNPYYQLEQNAEQQLALGNKTLTITNEPGLQAFEAEAQAVLIIGDTHETVAGFDKSFGALQAQQFDWFGLEMAPRTLQPAIDRFLAADEGTLAYEKAKTDILNGIWADRIDLTLGRTEKNHYFRLIKLAKERGVAVYALDSEEMYSFFGHGETPFGTIVRNIIWADAVPTEGTGLVFGGSAHFTHPLAVNVQDFIAISSPGTEFFTSE